VSNDSTKRLFCGRILDMKTHRELQRKRFIIAIILSLICLGIGLYGYFAHVTGGLQYLLYWVFVLCAPVSVVFFLRWDAERDRNITIKVVDSAKHQGHWV